MDWLQPSGGNRLRVHVCHWSLLYYRAYERKCIAVRDSITWSVPELTYPLMLFYKCSANPQHFIISPIESDISFFVSDVLCFKFTKHCGSPLVEILSQLITFQRLSVSLFTLIHAAGVVVPSFIQLSRTDCRWLRQKSKMITTWRQRGPASEGADYGESSCGGSAYEEAWARCMDTYCVLLLLKACYYPLLPFSSLRLFQVGPLFIHSLPLVLDLLATSSGLPWASYTVPAAVITVTSIVF